MQKQRGKKMDLHEKKNEKRKIFKILIHHALSSECVYNARSPGKSTCDVQY